MVPNFGRGLGFLIPAVTTRIGMHPVQEPIEEIREKYIQLITSVIIAVGPPVGAYIEDLVAILVRAFGDVFQNVRKVCSRSPLCAAH